MRFTLLLLCCSMAVAAASCGDVVTSTFGDASGSVGAGGGAGGPSATSTAGATGGVAGVGGGGGAPACSPAMGDCKTQLLDLRAKLGAAKACDPGAPDQCLESFQGPCCPEATSDARSPEVQCFLETLEATGCGIECTREPCAPLQGSCSDTGDGPPHCI